MLLTRRGFTLLETMVVLAILAVSAALAVPSILPMIHAAKLRGSAELVASIVGQARARAVTDRRCVRVELATTGAPHQVNLHQLNTYDCDVAPDTAPHIDGSILATGPWLPLRTERMPSDDISLTFAPAASEGLAAWQTGATFDLVFRSTGRLYSSDTDWTNDDVAIRIRHALLPAPYRDIYLVVQGHGRICLLDRGLTPVSNGDANDLNC